MEQMMVVDYQRRDEDQRHLQEGALAKIRKKLLVGDSLVASDEVDSSVCAAVKERFVMDTQSVCYVRCASQSPVVRDLRSGRGGVRFQLVRPWNIYLERWDRNWLCYRLVTPSLGSSR